MSVRGWPMLLAVTLGACLAIGCGVYLLSGGSDVRTVLSILAIGVGLSLASLVISSYTQSGYLFGHLRQVRGEMRAAERGFRDSHSRTEYLAAQILDLRQRSEQVSGAIMTGLNELKSSHSSLAEHMRLGNKPVAMGFAPFEPIMKPAASPPVFVSQPFAASPAFQPFQPAAAPLAGQGYVPPPPEHVEQKNSMLDQLSTSLEPVVDLFTGKTSHYRLHLGMRGQNGEEITSDVLLHHADRTGLRVGFDVHAARDALGLLRRLRQRDDVLSIFLPIGAATLQSGDAVDKLVGLRQEFSDVANGLVLEIPHAMLAGLADAGLEGLAELARHGHTFLLGNASVSGIDLPSLAKLNVRFVSLNAAAATGAEGPPQAVSLFAQSARALRVHVIVTNVADMRQVPLISKVSRFASGPAFAEPRRVKSDATQHVPQGYSAVA